MLGEFEADLDVLRTAASSGERRQVFRRLAIRYHPDKQHIATDDRSLAGRRFQELLKVYRVCCQEDAREVQQQERVRHKVCSLAFQDVVHGVTFGHDGETMVVCGDPGRIRLWRRGQRGAAGWRAARLAGEVSLHDTALAVGVLDAHRVVLAVGRRVEMWCFNDSGTVLAFEAELDSRAISVATAAEASRFAAGSCEGRVGIWSMAIDFVEEEAFLEHEIEGGRFDAECMRFTHLGQRLIVGGGAGVSAWQWDGSEWAAWTTIDLRPGLDAVYCLDAKGSTLAVAGDGGEVRVWGLQKHGFVDGPTSPPWSAALPMDEPSILRHSCQESVAVNAVSLSQSTSRLASGGSDCSILVWHCPSQCVIAQFQHSLPFGSFCCLNTATINAVQFSPDDEVLLAGGYDCHATVWSLPVAHAISDRAGKDVSR